MAKTRIKWNVKAFEEIRRTSEVESALGEAVAQILGNVGTDGYAGGVESGASRSRGYVVTTTGDAIRAEAEDHTLLRALGSVSL